MTVGLDLFCWLVAEGVIRVHHGRGQHTASDFLNYQRLQEVRYKRTYCGNADLASAVPPDFPLILVKYVQYSPICLRDPVVPLKLGKMSGTPSRGRPVGDAQSGTPSRGRPDPTNADNPAGVLGHPTAADNRNPRRVAQATPYAPLPQ